MTYHLDLAEQRDPVCRELFRWKTTLIEIKKMIAASQNVCVGVSRYFDACASPHRSDLKTRAVIREAVVREAVKAILIEEPYRNQELGIGGVTIVYVADLGK